MTSKTNTRTAIDGFGPRGLAALEALATIVVEKQLSVAVDIFDPFPHLGAGPNFVPEQSDLCILNIPVRVLNYAPPKFMSEGPDCRVRE